MGYIYAFAATLFWSVNIIIASYFAYSLQPLEIAAGRWFIASLVLVLISYPSLWRQKHLLWQNKWLIFWLAVTGVVLDNTLIYYAGRTTNAVNMGLLDITGPIFLVILSKIFFKTSLGKKQILGMGIAVLGVLTIILQGNFLQLSHIKFVSGEFFILINCFCFAVYSLLQTRRPPEIAQNTMLAATAVVGTFILLPFMFVQTGVNGVLNLTMEDLSVLAYLGVFNSVIAYLCWNTALNKIGNVKTGIIYYLIPLFSGIEAYFILNEQIYVSQLIGGALIILGITMVSLAKNPLKN